MNSWEKELKQRRILEIDSIEKSFYTESDLQKAQEILNKANSLAVVEEAYLNSQISSELLEKARQKAGVYANTPENRKKGIVGSPYKGGMDKKDEGKNLNGRSVEFRWTYTNQENKAPKNIKGKIVGSEKDGTYKIESNEGVHYMKKDEFKLS